MEIDDASDFYSILYNGHVKHRLRSISVINSNTATDILYLYNNTQPQRTVSWFVQAFRTESCTKFLCSVSSVRPTLLICETWLDLKSVHARCWLQMPVSQNAKTRRYISKNNKGHVSIHYFKNIQNLLTNGCMVFLLLVRQYLYKVFDLSGYCLNNKYSFIFTFSYQQ